MPLAIWLLGLMWHLAGLAWSLHMHRLHPKQESFVRQLSAYEIVTPVRVNDFGESFPQQRHYRRRRRSADSDLAAALRAHYRIEAFGERFHLNLSADAAFIAPSYAVTHLGAPDSRGHDPEDMRHCFFQGHVNGQHHHRAAFSLCTGLIGTFTTHNGEYFLEPLMIADEEYEDEHNKPHLLYKHERNRTSHSDTPEPCASSDPIKKHNHFHSNGSFEEEVKSVWKTMDKHLPGIQQSTMKNFPSGRRKKRFLSYPRFVELMVTADAKMVRHHGRNLEHYILTIMSVVAAVYKDPSIGNLVNIMIVKLIIIHNEQEGPNLNRFAAVTLHNFCVWQQTQNVLDDSHPSHHDTALLITREDICREKDKCDTLGLAELGTMCDPYRSCSISEENGLSSSFTIAHELGHVFNMPHDNHPKCREAGIKHQYHVMAPTLNYDTSPWSWSKCSQKYITEFLDTGYGECLLDEPVGRAYDLPAKLPGQIYNANRQCELMFGPGSQVCPFMRQCKRLWCTSSEGDHKGCHTQHMPLADGTECGHGMCNYVIQVEAMRQAERVRPKNGGRFCVGRRMKFRSCNTEPCPKGWRDFREEQCSQFDGKHFNISGLPSTVRWVPKYSGILMKDRCKLFCRVAGTMSYYQLQDRVVDGTPCGPDTNDICVQGLCRQAGCDHVLNSKARNDKCGVCGGDNSSCRTVAGTFNNAQYGYNVVVRIPAGATNIDIRQVSYSGTPEDDNYLALSDSHSNFLLNGNFVVSMFKREISFKGTPIDYSGSNTTEERINCTERMEEELVLQVLCVGNLYSPDVRYSFNIPIEVHQEQFVWDPSGPWQECSRMCQGERKRKPVCVRKSDHLVVSEQRCENVPRLRALMESCNTDCELRWHVAGKSECSTKCGPGFRTVEVMCMRYSQGTRGSERVESRACADLNKPQSRELCHGDCLLKSWQYSAWSQCSKSCGRGTRTRDSYCMNNLGRRLTDRECREDKRVVSEPCNDTPCPDWSISEWTECTVTCGKGVRRRQVFCVLVEERLSDELCDPNSKPRTISSCEHSECASWQVGAWSKCAVTCGHGYQMRAVRCVSSAYGKTMDDRECNAASRPRDNQECDLPACPHTSSELSTPRPAAAGNLHTQWRFGSWTTCSVSCGKGERARYVSCRDSQGRIADEAYCAHLLRPPETSVCFSPCGEWRAGEWSPCSVSCGVGHATRQVVCMNYNQQVDESFCHLDEKPSSEQECAAVPCHTVYQLWPNNQPYLPSDPRSHPGHSSWNNPSADHQWRTGPWGSCSSTCEGGFQRRVVVCQDSEGRSTNYCDERVKPSESKSCDSGPCPLWNYGVWGECSLSCGGGQRTRLVVCQRPNGQRLNEHNCEMLDKPPDMERCNTQPCPGSASWHRRAWKPCSVTCGKGTIQRELVCVYHNRTETEEEYCAHLPRPKTVKLCRAGPCPSWKTKKWQSCTVTCGIGVQKRDVYCRLKGKGHVSEDMCDARLRPSSLQQCLSRECHSYSWSASEWLECSVSCGIGYQQRMVSCTAVPSASNMKVFGSQSYTQVLASKCPQPPPPNTQPCRLPVCLLSVYWKAGPWSKCSQTCGAGVMQRTVECLTDKNLPSKNCSLSSRPHSQAACRLRHCELPSNCKELQMAEGIRKDGEHRLRVKSKVLQIYCAEMQTNFPKEYVTLRSSHTDNYSEMYGYRLINPFECPHNGSRRQDCACKNDYRAVGYTLFYRVRLDISTMRIITTDIQFSKTLLGQPVPFGSAGDCYSAARCPQGQFSINLTGTGLKVSELTKWVPQGNYVAIKVHRSEDGTRIYGRCGGFCGKCLPHPHTGLHVQVQ
ncbi:A disintegrin and metalloproteinase with thrombospondin motifs 20 [Bagarius yarrelli]|uniref:A disintegrin and metalloproteinase with thrombospondin motifs 20 n=1 Tax=Bagarius yarrelli TaxID=175774 RepID=A0A556THT0_BAGYA|nr:A disintegrin and metalloproteinase with thrombospondin motifs 20 [Bagarius yarrelli]